MPRSMWRGVVSFGMVSIPIRLFVATESHGVSFNQLCEEHMSRIRYKRWCEKGEHEVSYGDIVKGYEVSKDQYVVVTDEELENLPLPTSHTVEISEFVDRDDINAGLYFAGAYYVEPEDVGRKPYALLKRALEETGKVAVAKIAFRDREHLCALSPLEGLMLMNTLHWPDEIRSTEGIKTVDGEIKISDRELTMAKTLVESLADEFDPDRYHDEYKDALMQIVQAKVEGEEVVAAPEVEEAPKVMDLMEALKASVDAARKTKGDRKGLKVAEEAREAREASAEPARGRRRKTA
ncbi:MAG TPA: Ku protein [Candidatus Dormibacteraeota bacterium]